VDSISPDATPTPDDGRLARGRRRMAELATAYEAERQVEEQALLADLGREPSHAERLLIENASGWPFVRAGCGTSAKAATPTAARCC
jgi:hypothetical protein